MIEDKLCLLVCDVYKEEINSVLDSGELSNVELVTYPHVCIGNQGNKERLGEILAKCRNTYKYVNTLCDQCEYICKHVNTPLKMHDKSLINRCVESVVSGDLLAYLQSNQNSYIFTPGWFKTWQEHSDFWELYRNAADSSASDSTSKILLLDTGIDNDSKNSLMKFADFIGLPYDSIDIGLNSIRYKIRNFYTEWQIDRDKSSRELQITELNSQVTNYKMMCQVVGTLGKFDDEIKIIETAMDFIRILIGAKRIIYIPVVDNVIGSPAARVSISKGEREIIEKFFQSGTEYAWHSSDTGFIVRLCYIDETIGLLYVKDAVSRKCMADYLNLVLGISNPFALSISNSRHQKRLQEAREQLSVQATVDQLTGVLNRRTIIQRLETEIIRAGRQLKPLSVAMMDIDHLKKVNDNFGHHAGDTVLIKVAEQCKSSIRPYDYIGRFDGEEFLVIIPGADTVDAIGICERILSRIESLVIHHGNHEIKVTVSLGVSTLQVSGNSDTDSLIGSADCALYRAKGTGYSRVVHSDAVGREARQINTVYP
jgi:diguanylate cyclase (GGDEF)-like protein